MGSVLALKIEVSIEILSVIVEYFIEIDSIMMIIPRHWRSALFVPPALILMELHRWSTVDQHII